MSKKIYMLLIVIVILGVGVVIGRSSLELTSEVSEYIPQLKVIGDVDKVIEVNKDLNIQNVKIQVDEQTYDAVPLNELVISSDPKTKKFDVVLAGNDGLCAKIEGNKLDECYIYFSDMSGWSTYTKNHPINSRIKQLSNIVVVSTDIDWDYGVNIISTNKNLINITPGQMYLKESKFLPCLDGESTKTVEGKDYQVGLYKCKNLLPIKQLVGERNGKYLILSREGDYKIIGNEGYLELMDNQINYFNTDKRERIYNVKGILVDMPQKSIMNVYYDALHYIENDEKVLMIFIDGFGYHQYEYAKQNNYIPFMGKLEDVQMASSVFKPVTNAGFTAMITGQPPYINGIHNRQAKDFKTQSIFGKVLEMNKKALLVEGDIKILNTEVEPILNIDKNNNDSRDDEIFDTALTQMSNRPDFMMVHFHSVDDRGHNYGDLSETTMNMISIIDGYTEKLVKNWTGKIIITADHGMHKTIQGGTHGVCRYEDLIVPYFLLKGDDMK